MSDLKKAIMALAKGNTGFDAIMELATVKSVNKLEMTCTVSLNDNEDLILEDVKLKPIIPGVDITAMGIVSFPAVGSKVIIGQINNSECDLFVVSASKLQSIAIDAGLLFKLLLDLQTGGLSMTMPTLSLNGGKKGGLPMVNPLLSKVNQLEETVNKLIKDFKDHKHSGIKSGAEVSAGPTNSGPAEIVKTLLTEIENKAITQ